MRLGVYSRRREHYRPQEKTEPKVGDVTAAPNRRHPDRAQTNWQSYLIIAQLRTIMRYVAR